ncbi:MAG: response regulator [Nitrospirae bacterium]|nr:response regulator [Nitrospirota bacterium]
MNRPRVLIADSTPSVRQFIRYCLEDHFKNIEFEVANSGKNIQKRLEATHFDLILYDRDLPFLEGDELLVWLRSHQALKNIPFIMLSGDRSEDSVRKIIELGADACLVKPLLMATLVNKVKEIFNKFEKDKSDRRKYERVRGPGTVYLRFNSQQNQGQLLNISSGGMLSLFDREGPLPDILDRVGISIEADNKKRIEGLEGEIVRIQVVDTLSGPRHIHYAVRFMEDMEAEKKRQLAEFVAALHH